MVCVLVPPPCGGCRRPPPPRGGGRGVLVALMVVAIPSLVVVGAVVSFEWESCLVAIPTPRGGGDCAPRLLIA